MRLLDAEGERRKNGATGRANTRFPIYIKKRTAIALDETVVCGTAPYAQPSNTFPRLFRPFSSLPWVQAIRIPSSPERARENLHQINDADITDHQTVVTLPLRAMHCFAHACPACNRATVQYQNSQLQVNESNQEGGRSDSSRATICRIIRPNRLSVGVAASPVGVSSGGWTHSPSISAISVRHEMD